MPISQSQSSTPNTKPHPQSLILLSLRLSASREEREGSPSRPVSASLPPQSPFLDLPSLLFLSSILLEPRRRTRAGARRPRDHIPSSSALSIHDGELRLGTVACELARARWMIARARSKVVCKHLLDPPSPRSADDHHSMVSCELQGNRH